MSLKIPRKVKEAIKTIKGVKVFNGDHFFQYCFLATSPHFNIRVLETVDVAGMQQGERKWKVQFGYKPTFDKWSNSTNFETEIWYSPKKNQRFEVGKFKGKRRKQYLIPNLNKEVDWCKKVAQSQLFDWNSYFATIKTPWFIYS